MLRWKIGSPVVGFLCLAGCTADYSKGTTRFAEGVANVRDASAGIERNYVASQDLYYEFQRRVNGDLPKMTAGCREYTKDCFVSGETQERIENLNRRRAEGLIEKAGSPGGKYSNVEIGIGKSISIQFERINGKMEVSAETIPKVCLDYATKSAPEDHERDHVAEASGKPVTLDTIVTALDDYAQGLAAITKTSDADDYKAAASKLSKNVGALATILGTAAAGGAGVGLGEIATAAVDIGTHIQLARLENRRYEALKVAVLSACIPVNALARNVSADLETYTRLTQRMNDVMLSTLEAHAPVYRRDVSWSNLVIGQAVENIRKTSDSPGSAAQKIATVHNDLVVDVVSGKGQTEAFLENVDDFVSESKKLKDGIHNFRKSPTSDASDPSS